MRMGSSFGPPIVSHLFHITFYVAFEVFFFLKRAGDPNRTGGEQ